ncbi:hypothetical protein JOM56_011159 [Amanita muscaria]
MAKKHFKRTPQLRSRQTRSSKGRRLLSDPAESTQALNQQLAALGLYAVQTLGDGNCLFRALSDQCYGTDSRHAQVRQDVCDWIALHKSRYSPFVDDERGIDVHLRCMRENATYGGHMELSAFAHLTRRNIKVIQPGLVYVIEWNAGGDPEGFLEDKDSADESDPIEARDRRRQRRDRLKEKKQAASAQAEEDGEDEPSNYKTMYVAYYDWEHFSSIRNLKGPHGGLPCVQETPAPTPMDVTTPSSPPSKHLQKHNVKRVKLKLGPPTPSSSKPPSTVDASPKEESDPLAIPLPSSRSTSPTPSLSALSSLSPSPIPYPLLYAQLDPSTLPRITRSPKRNFDESANLPGPEDGDEYGSEAGTKRARVGSRTTADDATVAREIEEHKENGTENGKMVVDDGDEHDEEPSAQPPKSTISAASDVSSVSSLSSSSSSSSPSPPPPSYNKQTKVSTHVKQMQRTREKAKERPLTRRQLKAMGLKTEKKGTGVIVIPAGKRAAKESGGDAETAKGEWLKNGTGRVDVRGFRELKI